VRTWATQNRCGTVTTPQFIALAEQISRQDLAQFFKVWIYEADKPAPDSW
jgi:aminopeptidase N